MVKVKSQDIPSGDAFKYSSSLRSAVDHPTLVRTYGTGKYGQEKYGATLQSVQRRYPFRQPYKQNSSPRTPTAAQRSARGIFRRCVNCFNAQPKSGGATPPALGPRNREFWYTSSGGSGLFYYDYFMQQSLSTYYGADSPDKYPFTPVVPDWCKGTRTDGTHAYSLSPDSNQGSGFPHLLDGWRIGDTFREFTRVFLGFKGQPISYLLVGGDVFVSPSHKTNLKAEVWNITEPWDKNTLTWNNMPALDRKLGEAVILDDVSPIAFTFDISWSYGVSLRLTPESLKAGGQIQITIDSVICGI